MKSEKEIWDRIHMLAEGANEDIKANRADDAADKAIYITALKWVMHLEPPSPKETKPIPPTNNTP